MNQLNLDEIKNIELNLLFFFKRYCEKNNIRYFLSNGTLLGAIKYKGFIPWDDDIDVFVPREDYDRLVNEFLNIGNYYLFSFERESHFFYPFAKLCDMSTIKKESNVNNGIELGVDIDIFPLDYWSDDFNKAKKEVDKIKNNMFYLGLTKTKKADSINPVKRIVKSFMMIVCKLFGSKYFIKKIINESNKGKKNLYLGCKTWCIYDEREIIPAEVFSDIIQVEFENESFCAPIGYDLYLRRLYGDYEQDPPAEKQKTHHAFKAYKL